MKVKFSAYVLFFCSFFVFVHAFAESNPSLQVSPASVSFNVGTKASLKVSNASGTVSATSNEKSIVSTSYYNKVLTLTALKVGSTTVEVKDRKTTKKIPVTVTAASSSSLSVFPVVVAMNVGGTSLITVTNASGTVAVSSSNTAVASVSYASGTATVKGVTPGTATITVKDSKTSKTVSASVISGTVSATDYTLLAWNDLGMHCMDGLDFSVFAILPPYNTLHAQLKNKLGGLVTSGVNLTYEAVADSTGSINSYSVKLPYSPTNALNKTNFWDWVQPMTGLNPDKNVGVNLDKLASGSPEPGSPAPSFSPAPLTYNAAYGWYEAEGIPITPFDDAGKKNFYPTVKVVAKDSLGKILATTTTVLPVSDEMTCKACHASTTSTNSAAIAAKPVTGWVNDPDPNKDWKKNILKLHDQEKLSSNLYQTGIAQNGYNPSGLLATATAGKPVLCVACHASNAYFDKANLKTVMPGVTDIRPFTQALHTKHAGVVNPADAVNPGPTPPPTLNDISNRTACYLCHPGSETQCLRGAMSKAVDTGGKQMSCQNCHGKMTEVGSSAREGWFNEPTCESCHNSAADNKRAMVGVDANGISLVPADHTFATNADTPVKGLNLYRFSKGHGGLQCEACHGATHAEYPSAHVDDNTQSIAVQGHAGTVAECSACHKTIPTTVNGGPHGMHTTGDAWVKSHEKANKNGSATTPSCAYCHGTTRAGTPLSAIKVAKTINAGEFGIKNWPANYQVSCFSCHNGPNP
ncbi:MAG: hypothetical protein ABL903_07970 [Methylococcales bacterium]